MTRLVALLTLLILVLAAATASAQDVTNELLNRDNAAPENPLRAEGEVKSAEGPAANVEVMLEITDMRIRRQVSFLKTRADGEGRFEFDLSKIDVPEMGLQFNTVSPRYIESMKIVVARKNELPVHVELEVEPGAALAGLVTDNKDQPLEGVHIVAPHVHPVTSGADGHFEVFGLKPGSRTQLRFSKQGYSEAFLPVTPQDAELVEGEKVVMEPASSLEGTVLDPLGRPVANATVVFRTPDVYQRQPTDEKGHFHFEGVPRELSEATLEPFASRWLGTERKLAADEITSAPITLSMHAGVTLGGIARGPDAKPAGGVRVAVSRKSQRVLAQVSADAEGRWSAGPFDFAEDFVLAFSPPATESTREMGELVFTIENADKSWSAEVKPWPRGFNSQFTVTIAADGGVKMKRMDTGAGGQPGEVLYEGKLDREKMSIDGTVKVTSSGATGTFNARKYDARTQSPKGDWDMREEISAGEVAAAPAIVPVNTGVIAGRRIVEAQLAKPLTLSGVVFQKPGAPVTRGTVRLVSWNDLTVYTATAPIEAGGEFTLEGLPEGVLQVVAINDEGEPSPPRYARGGIKGFEIFFEPPEEDPADSPATKK